MRNNRQTKANTRRNQRKTTRRGNKEDVLAHRPPIVRYTKGVFGFPLRMEVRMRYAAFEGLFLSSTTGSVNKNFFSCNSIFDPDRTGTGHQPLYRDTYAAVYNQYCVVSSKIRVRYLNNNSTAYWNCGVTIEDDNAGSSVIDTLAEQSTSDSDFQAALSGSNSVLTLNKNWDCAKFLNIDPYSSETYKTAIGSNPNEEQFFMLWGNDAGGGTSNLPYQVVIEYTVLFTELTTPTQS